MLPLIAVIILILQYPWVLAHYAVDGFESRIDVILRLIPFSCIVYFIIWIVKGWNDLPWTSADD